jgi:hypothetical protein
MQNNHVKNKLLFSLSACAILLGLSNSSALAQQKYPTEAQIQQAKTDLRQHVQSMKNNGHSNYIDEDRTSEQIQNREKFVSAWKQIEPGIAPFLGAWKDYESVWYIYPSTVKQQVCIFRGEIDFANFYLGKLNNGNIQLQSGEVIFPEGEYLGIIASQNQINSEIPLNSPTVPRDPHSFNYIYDFDPTSLLQAYKQAGCTASLPSKPSTKIPDSLKLTLEQKGGNTETEFVKGDDGYYKWFVKKEGFLASLTNTIFSSLTNNTSGTCLGLKENQDLAKVRLTTYPCDSPEGSRKWEILMVNDNTGYKIKLPNTKYCLGENIGVLDCDSPDAPVENLTPKQLEEFIAINPHLNYRRDSSTTTVAKTFEDVTAFGVRQFLKADYSLQPAYDRLANAAKDQYDLVEVPNNNSMAKSFATIQPKECRGEWGCRSKAVEVSYGDYLKLKLKLKTQSNIIRKIFEEQGIYNQIKNHQEKLSHSKQQQAKKVDRDINSNFETFIKFAEDTHKNPSLWERLTSKKQWIYASEELKYSVPNFIVSIGGTGGKAAASIPAISTLIDTLTIPKDLAESLKQIESARYIKVSAEKIGEMKNAFLAGNIDEMRQINLDMAVETIELIDSTPNLKRTGEVLSAYSSAKALIERDEVMKKLEPLDILNGQDKFYFNASQIADAIDFTASVISAIYPESFKKTAPPKYQKYFNVLEAAKPVKDLLYESLANSYKDNFILDYESTENMIDRNQKVIKELHSWIDTSGTSVGGYLLQNYGQDTVGLAGNGKNVYVTKDDVYYTPN